MRESVFRRRSVGISLWQIEIAPIVLSMLATSVEHESRDHDRSFTGHCFHRGGRFSWHESSQMIRFNDGKRTGTNLAELRLRGFDLLIARTLLFRESKKIALGGHLTVIDPDWIRPSIGDAKVNRDVVSLSGGAIQVDFHFHHCWPKPPGDACREQDGGEEHPQAELRPSTTHHFVVLFAFLRASRICVARKRCRCFQGDFLACGTNPPAPPDTYSR